jgi:hypothetical protein
MTNYAVFIRLLSDNENQKNSQKVSKKGVWCRVDVGKMLVWCWISAGRIRSID